MFDRKECDRQMAYDARVQRRRNARVLLTKRSICAMVSPVDVLLWGVGLVTMIMVAVECLVWLLRLL